MTTLLDTLTVFLKAEDWPFEQIDDAPILRLDITGQHARWTCYAEARQPQQQLAFYSVCPHNTPPARRAATVEFITRANYGLISGNFEMDYDNGEIRFKTSIDVEGAELTPPLIRSLLYGNIATFDRYLPGLLDVLSGSAEPLAALARVES